MEGGAGVGPDLCCAGSWGCLMAWVTVCGIRIGTAAASQAVSPEAESPPPLTPPIQGSVLLETKT